MLRYEIISRFPREDIKRYVEVFGGAGWVLFAKERVSGQVEVCNDANSDLVNLFRCVKYHCQKVQKELEWMIASRELFMDCREQLNMRGLTGTNTMGVSEYLTEVQQRLKMTRPFQRMTTLG